MGRALIIKGLIMIHGSSLFDSPNQAQIETTGESQCDWGWGITKTAASKERCIEVANVMLERMGSVSTIGRAVWLIRCNRKGKSSPKDIQEDCTMGC